MAKDQTRSEEISDRAKQLFSDFNAEKITENQLFRELHDLLHNALRRHLYGRCGIFNADDLAELFQRFMVRFYQAWRANAYDIKQPLWPWAKTVSARIAIDEFRVRQHRNEHQPPVEPGAWEDMHNDSREPQARSMERNFMVREALARLKNPRDREILRMRLEGHTQQEIADSLNMTRENVEKRIEAALKELNKISLKAGVQTR